MDNPNNPSPDESGDSIEIRGKQKERETEGEVGSLEMEKGRAFEVYRHRIDICDLVLPKLPVFNSPSSPDSPDSPSSPSNTRKRSIVVSKHLCGVATDYTLRCVARQTNNPNNPNNPHIPHNPNSSNSHGNQSQVEIKTDNPNSLNNPSNLDNTSTFPLAG